MTNALADEDQKLVQERVEGRSWTLWYEGYLLTPISPVPGQQTGSAADPQSAVQFKKSGKVYFYVSPKVCELDYFCNFVVHNELPLE